MAADLSNLDVSFQNKAKQLLDNCKARGIEMIPFFTTRDVLDQARIYRRSRDKTQVVAKANELKRNGAAFLADCLLYVGPQPSGPWATNATPGLSWHQWGLAIDCFWDIDSSVKEKAEWSTTKLINGVNGYQIYANEAVKLGLFAGYYWKTTDPVHVQSIKYTSPTGLYKLNYINDIMKKKYEHLLV